MTDALACGMVDDVRFTVPLLALQGTAEIPASYSPHRSMLFLLPPYKH